MKAESRSERSIVPRLQRNFQDFLQSMSDVLIDITALEVNTMVVEEITGTKFIPWQVYRNIYPISSQYLAQIGVHESLRDRYLSLRKQLEIEYCLLLVENDPTAIAGCHILTDPNVSLDEIGTKLPNPLNLGATPTEVARINDLLDNGTFLRSLRKIGELKAALDRCNNVLNQGEKQHLPNVEDSLETDIIYAQTIVQLDGDIINRFHQKLLNHEHKDTILQIHQAGVISGETQWRGLLNFIVNLVESIIGKPASLKRLSPRR